MLQEPMNRRKIANPKAPIRTRPREVTLDEVKNSSLLGFRAI